MPQTTEQLLQERERYLEAWRKTGVMSHSLTAEIAHLHFVFPEGWFNWGIILNKLVRILGDPKHLDSWRDIAGYATLVVEYLEKEEHEIRG
jgi:predicted acylesterase/phospholipase RssA